MNTKLSQSKGKSFLTRVLTMFLIVALLFGMAPSGTFAVYAEDSANAEQAEGSGITSWSQLKDAIEKGTDAEISISGKLIATEEINVGRPVKITGDATIYRSGAKGANQDFSNFVVGAGGDLTLSGGVTMTGDRECVAGQPISEDKINEEKTPINQIGDDVKPEEHTETGKQYWMYSDKGILLTTDASKASTFTMYNDSKKVVDYVPTGIRIFIGYGDKFLKDMTIPTTDTDVDGLWVNSSDAKYGFAAVAQSGGGYKLAATDSSTFAYFLYPVNNRIIRYAEKGHVSDAPVFQYNNGVFSIDSGSVTYYTVEGLDGTFETEGDALAAIKNHNDNSYEVKYTVEGLDGTFDTREKAIEAINEHNNNLQECDQTGSVRYTRDQFGSEKGFFIHASNGGKVTIEDATLTGYNSSGVHDGPNCPLWSAPVVLDGGHLTMTGGNIINNTVSYIADESQSGLEVVATKNYVKNRMFTNSAGALIVKNGGTANISGGHLDQNKGDSGAVIATGAGTEVNISGNATIDKNVGLHHAGAVLVEHGATVNMTGGQMNNNVTWSKGGAVWATDYGTNGHVKKDWSANPRPAILNPEDRGTDGGYFNMSNGTLDGNTAFIRGGAINVESNGVSLTGGTISNNNCRSLGGGIYVEGDSADYTYTLYIHEGYIGRNESIGPMGNPAKNDKLDRKLGARDANGDVLTGGTAASRTIDRDFNNHFGDGGGIWLCPIGGAGSISIDDKNTVVIDSNNAKNHGKDIYLIRGNGALILGSSNGHVWKNEDNNTIVDDSGKTFSGPFAVTNVIEPESTNLNGIQIVDNLSRDGGGIAADGTVVFGTPGTVWRHEASLQFVKNWSIERKPEKTKFRVMYVDESGNKNSLSSKEDEYVFVMDGEADSSDNYGVVSETEKTDAYTWNELITLPNTYTDKNGVPQALFMYEAPDGTIIDPSTQEGLKALNNIPTEEIKVAPGEWKIVVEELDASGNVKDEYTISSTDVEIGSFEKRLNASTTTVQLGNSSVTAYVSFLTVAFKQGMNNDAEPAIEKYVNKAVHKYIDLDEVFTYDILAYVPMDADKVVITDKLVDDLQFASSPEDIKVVALSGKNNHKPHNDIHGYSIDEENEATVLEEGTDVEGAQVVIDPATSTLTVTVENELVSVTEPGATGFKNAEDKQYVTPHRGHWIKVTFDAQLKESVRNAIKAEEKTIDDLNTVDIKADENAPVLSNEAHGGVDNTADLKVDVKNEHKSEYDRTSNTVTVIPEEEPEPTETSSGLSIVATKELKGGNINSDEFQNAFTFKIEGSKDAPMPEKIITTNIGNKIDFGKIEFNKAGVFTYTISEAPGEINGVIYDNTPKSFTVTVEEVVAGHITSYVVTKVEAAEGSEDAISIQVKDVTTPSSVPSKAIITSRTWADGYVNADNNGNPHNTGTFTLKSEDKSYPSFCLDFDKDFAWRQDTITPTRQYDVTYTGAFEHSDLDYIKEAVYFGYPYDATGKVREYIESNYGRSYDETGRDMLFSYATNLIIWSKTNPGKQPFSLFEGKKIGNIINQILAQMDANDIPETVNMEMFVYNPTDTYTSFQPMLIFNAGTSDIKVSAAFKNEVERPEIEKYVEEAVHKDLDSIEQEFKYDIIAYVTKDADSVEITDTLKDYLVFASQDVQVVDLGTEVNHKPFFSVDGTPGSSNATVHLNAGEINGTDTVKSLDDKEAIPSIDKQTLTVSIPDAKEYRGHWIKVRFTAKINPEYSYDELVKLYKEIDPNAEFIDEDIKVGRDPENKGNAPVKADKGHKGLPNTAQYSIGVENKAGYKDTSNTVTVTPPTPKEYPVKISKTNLGGTELEGADMILTDADGNEIESWTSSAEGPKELSLREGTYILKEEVAPEGYEKVTTEMKFTVNSDGTVTVYEIVENDIVIFTLKEGEDNHIVLKDSTIPETPEIEKYVEKDVHADLVEFDKEFEYAVMAYVPKDAVAIEITDNLNSCLHFVSTEDEIAATAQAFDDNDHTAVTGTVSKAGEKIKATATIKDQVLKVRVADVEGQKLGGKYVKVTFKAQINDGLKTLEALTKKDVKDNAPIITEIKDHNGIPNQASYTIEIDNEGHSREEYKDIPTNEVTVIPQTVKYAGAKEWTELEEGTWPKGVKVTFNLINSKTGEVVDKIELTETAPTKSFAEQPKLEGVTYKVEEVAVTGYEMESTSTSVDGDVTTVTFVNKPEEHPVKISKTDLGGTELEGAQMELKDSKNATVKEWVSSAEGPEELTLKQGTYTLVELVAPKGYDKVETKMTFTVNSDGTVAVKEVTENGEVVFSLKEGETDHIVLKDAPTKEPEEPELDKYVEKDVHADLVEFDKVFEYAILAYVPNDAVAIEITDDLNKNLHYVSTEAAIEESAEVLNGNDHTAVTGSVSKTGEKIKATAKITGQALKVRVDDVEGQKLGGKYVKITVKAQINEALRTLEALDTAKVEDNGLVITEIKDHEGIKNQAKYTIEIDAEGNSKAEYENIPSNEVTVIPQTAKFAGAKEWTDLEEGTWPKGVKVTFNLINSKTGDVVDKIELTETEPTKSFVEQPKLEGVTYKVEEVAVPGYTKAGVTTSKEADTTTVTYTNKPEEPEIEKYVEKDVHADLAEFDKEFEYAIIAYVPQDAVAIEMTDALSDCLDFVSTEAEIAATAEAFAENDHTAVTGTVSKAGDKVKATATITGQNLKVRVAGVEGQKLGGKYVKVTFKAQIKEELRTLEALTKKNVSDNAPIITEIKDHNGIPNKASYTIEIDNEGNSIPKYENIPSNEVTVIPQTAKFAGAKEWTDLEEGTWPKGVEVTFNLINSKTGKVVDTIVLTEAEPTKSFAEQPKLEGVTYKVEEVAVEGFVKANEETKTEGDVETTTITNKPDTPPEIPETPGEEPEIEKYVEKDVHADLVEFDKEFEYAVIAYVPKDAVAIEITDALNDCLQFVSNADEIAATAEAFAENDHTAVTGTVSKTGDKVEATATITGQNLKVRVADVEGQKLGGKYVKVTFKAQIKEELRTLEALNTKNVTDNTPVITEIKDHKGIPNKASYTIEIDNEGNSKPEYTDIPTNEVTVIPQTAKFAGAKEWTDLEEGTWPKGVEVTFNLINGKTGEAVDTIVLTEAEPTKNFAEQPKLEGVTYIVEEVPVEGFTKVSQTEKTSDDVTTVTITNKPDTPPEIPETPGEEGSFTIKKVVTGAAESNKQYAVEITLVYPDFHVAEGQSNTETIEMLLTPDETYTVAELPVGTKVSIVEKTTGYEVSYLLNAEKCEKVEFEVETGIVNGVVVINYKKPETPPEIPRTPGEPPATGDANNMMLWISLAGIAAATTVVLAARRRRNSR